MLDLFPDEDYRFHIGVARGDIAEFFKPTLAHDEIITERKCWLGNSPRTYAALLPDGEPLLDEVIEIAQAAGALPADAAARLRECATPWERCLGLGQIWEPDFLLLRRSNGGPFNLFGACVCFPSSWSLAEKIGQPLEFIHGPVPGLSDQIGPQIDSFLSKMKPGVAWLRSNWGLSRSPELNQHPERKLSRLDATVNSDEVWLRVEHQALVALPKERGLLFGIRLTIHPLNELRQDAEVARRLSRALATMPEDVARYKGLATARTRLLEFLG